MNNVADDDIPSDEQIFIQLHLKGLGGNSTQLDALLTDNIDGYAQWQAIYN